MNIGLVNGTSALLTTRAGYYDRMVAYSYFKHAGGGPDFCYLIGPDKSKPSRSKEKGHCVGKIPRLATSFQLRIHGGNTSELVGDYRGSKACRRWAFVFLGFKPRI